MTLHLPTNVAKYTQTYINVPVSQIRIMVSQVKKKIKQTANHGGLRGKDVSHAKRHIQMLRDSKSKLIKTLDTLNTQRCNMKIHLEIGTHLTRILVQIGKSLVFIFKARWMLVFPPLFHG